MAPECEHQREHQNGEEAADVMSFFSSPPLKLWKQQLVQLHCYYCHFNLSGPSYLLLLLLLLCLFPQF